MSFTSLIGVGWIAAMAAGLALALYASARTVHHARFVVEGSRIPPFFVGITLLAVGTDLPEIANSLVSCFAGHGDLNAGDSIGSTITQATLVLGLLPFFVGPIRVRGLRIASLCLVTMVALAAGVLLLRDGYLSRVDGILLVGAWIGGSALLWRPSGDGDSRAGDGLSPHRLRHGMVALGFLALVGLGSALAVMAFAELSSVLGVPEYLLSFFLASFGTSLPELIVDVTALRSGLRGLAIGNTLGSSFVDATLSIGIGPLFFPSAVTAALAVPGSVTAVVAIGLVGVLLAVGRRHGRATGAALIALYLGVYYAMLA